MKTVTLIFPHQLFRSHPCLQQNEKVYLIEECLFFRQYNFHKHKLILHRATMKFYEDYLRKNDIEVEYVDTINELNDVRKLIGSLKGKVENVQVIDPVDNWLMRRLTSACKKNNIKLTFLSSPGFLNDMPEANEFFNKRSTYFQTDFYIYQRKKRHLLLEANNQPLGGKWSFDAENRQKFPKKEVLPAINFYNGSSWLMEAKEYVIKHFPDNYGSAEEPYFFACTFEDAEKWLDDFLVHRFEKFGIYEDAIVARESILHHSVLTPMLNTGLLEPEQVLEAVLAFANNNTVPLNSLEGFIRQITGWREFIRIVYEREGTKQRTRNFWNFKRKIPESFWKGTTGIGPVDVTIKKVLQTGYCHHIERLMVLGNFMLLCEFDPDEVYRWFMELFIDAYDWVMVPNVYGMTQFSDGGLMTTKPYISGSNYIVKMSDHEKGEWQAIWDGLFWRFMFVHSDFFLQNPRLGMLLKTFEKMSDDKRTVHLTIAEKYLDSL